MPQTESQRTHTPQRTHTLQSKSPKTKRTILQTRLTLVSSLLPQAAHCKTHVYFFMEATQDTHTHKHTNVRSAFHPSRTVLPPRPPRSSGQLLSARGPSEWIMFCFKVDFHS